MDYKAISDFLEVKGRLSNQTKSDYISRETLKERLEHKYILSDLEHPNPRLYRHTDIMDVIDTIPAADVEERKVGKWIRKDKGGVFGNPIYKCSCCGQGDFGNLFIYGASYCPNCGAKMEDNE